MLQLEGAPLLDLLEASYDSAQANEAWATRVVNALMSLTSAQAGGSVHFTSGYEDNVFRLRTVDEAVPVGQMSWNAAAWTAMMRVPSPLSETMLGRTQGTSLASITGLGAMLEHTPGFRDCFPAPTVDSLGLVALDANGDGFCACVALDRLATLTPRESALLTKLATHVGAGVRLRRAPRSALLADAEAILTPSGKVLHAAEVAQDKRDSLDEGRRRRDEARKTTHDAEKAVEIWKGLVAGRWSLVDHFDTDGKRFLLAIKNAPQVDRRADLTARERRVCALVAMGHRDKEIAYMLGLSMASVTAALHRARGKLGVSSRAQLATIWRRGQVPEGS